MKATIVFFACVFAIAAAKLQCDQGAADVPKDWIDMVNPCVEQMRHQIQKEINASMQYLAMAAHFSRDTVNRPGFAKMFFKSASEEREHAIKLISYLLMRGELTSSVSKLIQRNLNVDKTEWKNAVSALKDALNLEAAVTKSIRKVIQVCETPTDGSNFNDYHLVDYLTGEFLEEQYKGQRDLAGKISTLDKIMDKHGPLGEFMFDKDLLKSE